MLGRCLLALIILVGVASSVHADDTSWTLDRVIATARTRAPASTVARAQIDEARAALVGARRLSTRNPVLQADVGPRWADGRSTDLQSQLSIPLDLGGRRAKRIAVAEAEIRQQELVSEAAVRQAVARAVNAYYTVLHAERRLALAQERVQLAIAAEATAAQRHAAGDVSEFEVNLARGEVARAHAGVASAQSEASRARGQLAAALGVPVAHVKTVTGELADRAFVDASIKRTGTRADLQALAQEATLARAEAALAQTARWPGLDFNLSFEHERDADIFLGGIAVALPLLDRGQGDAARAYARAKRAEAELAARTTLAGIQVQSAQSTYSSAVTAARLLEQQAIPVSLENEKDAAASYRAGKIDFATMIVIRREALETRREHLDRLLEAALAGVELWVAQGTNL